MTLFKIYFYVGLAGVLGYIIGICDEKEAQRKREMDSVVRNRKAKERGKDEWR